MRPRWLIPLFVLLLAACGTEPDDPEGRLRATLAAAEQAIEAGCDDYDTKPVNFARLLEKINALTQSAA